MKIIPYLPFISFIMFTLYLLFIITRFKELKSISESFYRLDKKWIGLFTLAIWSFTIPIVVYAESGLLFFAGAFVAIVGAAPSFKLKHERLPHFVGATGGIIFGFISLIIDYNAIHAVISGTLLIGIAVMFFEKQKVLIVEVIAFYTIIIPLMFDSCNKYFINL